MSKIKWCTIVTILLALLLTTASASNIVPFPKQSLFADPEVNALIDANYALIQQNGWAELRIPQSLHGITEDRFSPYALDAAHRLIDAGYEACIIGGAVRDLVMGTETMDFDITTTATYEQAEEVLSDVEITYHPGGDYTFAMVHYPEEAFDLARCVNIPAPYLGQPSIPEFDPEELYSDSFLFDSFQRDLTFNAIYYDVRTGDLVDYHGGLHDIREQIIAPIVEPKMALDQDPRTAVRAMRFKARYGYAFSDALEELMRSSAAEYVANNAPGANRSNMPRYFSAGYALSSYQVLKDYDAFTAFFPPVKEIYASDEYQRYITAAMDWLDAWYAAGNEIVKAVPMEIALWPVIADGDAESVLQAERDTITIYDDEMAAHLETLQLMEEMTDVYMDADVQSIINDDNFEKAYILLMVRAETDASLEEAAAFWTEVWEGESALEAA